MRAMFYVTFEAEEEYIHSQATEKEEMVTKLSYDSYINVSSPLKPSGNIFFNILFVINKLMCINNVRERDILE